MATKLSEKKKVLVGMSGGIDSSAVCMLLQDQGYEVLGITLRMWDIPSHFSTPGQKEPDHVLEARSFSRKTRHPALYTRCKRQNSEKRSYNLLSMNIYEHALLILVSCVIFISNGNICLMRPIG